MAGSRYTEDRFEPNCYLFTAGLYHCDPRDFEKAIGSNGGRKMKRILAAILMSVALFLASSSCTLKKGELRLLYMEIHEPGRLLTSTQFWVRVNFEADGHPEIRRACFYWFGDGPYCVNVENVEYGSFAYFDVPLDARYGSSVLQCYVEYLRNEKIERSNAVACPVNGLNPFEPARPIYR